MDDEQNNRTVIGVTVEEKCRAILFKLKANLPSSAMCRGQNPLVRYQHAGAVKYLVRATEDRGQKRPVARQRRSPAYNPRLPVHCLRSSSHTALYMNNETRTGTHFCAELTKKRLRRPHGSIFFIFV